MTLAHRTLGRKRIQEICQANGLRCTDIDIVDELLVRWKKLVGNLPAKLQVALELTGNNPNRAEILGAILAITLEFTEKQLDGHPSETN